MKARLHTRAAIVAFGLALFLVPGVHSQGAGNVRVVRLSRTEGQVLVSHSGDVNWEDAPVNLPLQEGDTLATQGGFAEIEFEDGATAFLAENSILQITHLGFSGAGRVTELGLTQGTGTFNANLTSQDTFRVQALTFDVAIPESAEFRVDGFRDGAAIQVLVGDVSVSTAKGSTNLEKGQSVAIHESGLQDSSIGGLSIAEDAFDQWVTQEGEIIRSGNKNTLSYINSPNYYGLSDLSRYGTWVNAAGFGYSWRPFSVGFAWTPYFNGRWVLNLLLGWIWVSEEPWGWMPYHFGSWLLSPNLGWLWVPGGPAGLRQWEPARVNWIQVGNQVGWVAMSPNDRTGAPANATKGVITKPSQSPRNGIESNEIVTGKRFAKYHASEAAAGGICFASNAGTPRAGRILELSRERAPDDNQSIVFDQGTRTYINRDGSNEPNRNQPGKRNNAAPVRSALGALDASCQYSIRGSTCDAACTRSGGFRRQSCNPAKAVSDGASFARKCSHERNRPRRPAIAAIVNAVRHRP